MLNSLFTHTIKTLVMGNTTDDKLVKFYSNTE